MYQKETKISPEEHDYELYVQATTIKHFDLLELEKLRDACITEKGKRDIDSYISWQYHMEEARGGMI